MTFTPEKPKYTGDGIAIWEGRTADKDELFLKVQVLGGKTINCFENKPKEEPTPETPTA